MPPKSEPVVISVAARASTITKVADVAGQALGKWEPIPTQRPLVNSQLIQLPALERANEVLRYNLARLNHWLSPGGFLREWLRHCLNLTVLVAIPILLLTPVLTLILTSAVTWSAAIAEVFHNLALAAQWIATALLWIGGIVLALRLMTRR